MNTDNTACSGDKTSDWCSDIPLHYTDKSGKSYCIFHTPKGLKGNVEGEFFNRRVFEWVRMEMEEKGSCDMSGTVFDWDVDFSRLGRLIPFDNLNFSKAQFHGRAGFSASIFNGTTDFSDTLFSTISEFKKTVFNGPCNFKGTTFKGKPYFFNTIFNEFTDFDGVTFEDGTLFTRECFKAGSNFNGSPYGERALSGR